MIHINDKHDCCGCAACVQICPKSCIRFDEDEQGFRYPLIDKSICVDCGLCEKVCPVLNQFESKQPLKVFAAKNPDDQVRLKSSSGGIFTMLAEYIINHGGVVFGARFDEQWEVEHAYTETIEGLEQFRGSKYVQSRVGITYKQAKDFLNAGRKVLYTGTPCQIAGLKKFLIKEYDNLLTLEIVCHGVPSPLVWRDYLDYKRTAYMESTPSFLNKPLIITDISFRDKTHGWKQYGFKICYTAHSVNENTISELDNKVNCEISAFTEDIFMKGFLKNLYLRPSCHYCPANKGKSGADISLADYWGIQLIHPGLDDNKGVGLVLINTLKGVEYYNSISAEIISIASSYDFAITHNPCIVESVREPNIKSQFWQNYKESKIHSIEVICAMMTPPPIVVMVKRILRKIKSII